MSRDIRIDELATPEILHAYNKLQDECRNMTDSQIDERAAALDRYLMACDAARRRAEMDLDNEAAA